MSTISVKPNLKGQHSQAHRILDERVLRGIGFMRAGNGVLIEWDGSQYVISSTARNGNGISGWHFEKTIEVDPTKTYPAQTVIHVQPTHAIVTTGIRDAANPTGDVIHSKPGFYISTQAVSPKKTVSGHDVWNLPQFPLPTPDNLDDKTNFWIFFGDINC